MPSTYSPNLRVELIANGEQSGTWGNTTNVNLGTILDSAIAGYTNVTVGSATNLALTANNGASDQSRNMIVQLSSATGTGTDFNLFIPPASKFYVIRNDTTKNVTIGNSTALNGTTASGGTTVTIKTGVTSLIFSDGTNVREALSGFAGNLIIDGNLTVNGNTTLGSPRVSGTYTYVSASVIQVNTGTPHGYTAGQSVGLIVTSVTDGNAKSGYYAIAGTPTPTQFNLTYTPANLEAVSAGSCLVTNDTITLNGIVQPGVIIEGSSSTLPALRVTAQSGTAAAFVVDDTNNPDASPFLIDASGNVVTGYTEVLTKFNNSTASQSTPRVQEIGTTINGAGIGIALFNTTNSSSGVLEFAKSANADIGTYTAVADGEALGLIRFSGSDDVEFSVAASIGGFADGEFNTGTPPGDLSDSPGRLVFSTTPDGTDSPLERMRIDNAGDVIIGAGEGTTSATGGLLRAPNETGGSNLIGANLTIAAGNGTGTSGGSGSILFQTAPVNTTGAATDPNTLATVMAIANTGNVGIGSTSLTSISFRISKDIANPAGGTAYGIYQDGTIPSATPLITQVIYNNTLANTEAASFTLANLTHYRASQSTFTGGSSVDDQYGYVADSTLVGATDNYGFYAEDTAAVVATKTAYGFYSGVNTATGGGTAYGFYAAGTATNYFASNLLIGDDTALVTRNNTGGGTITPVQQIIGTTESTSSLGIFNYSATTSVDSSIAFSKSLTGTVGTRTQTTNGTELGGISFNGVGITNDAAFASAAFIRADVNSATLATGSVPGRLLFGTTNVGETAPSSRMTLDNRGMLSIGIAAASGPALSTTAPAKLFIDNDAYEDTATTAGGIVTHGTINAIRAASITSDAATNITYTTASTLYIEGAPTNGTNVNAITYPYALFIDSGNMRLDGNLTQVGSTATAIVVPLTIEGLTTATPDDNITTALNFRTQTGATNVEIGAAIRAICTDVTSPEEDFDLSFLTMYDGDTIPTTATGNTSERLRLKSTGELQFNSGYGSVATAFGCRAWVNFDGTASGTFAGGVSTVSRSSGSTTATVTTTNDHGLIDGNQVFALTGVAVGTYTVTVTGAKTFTITTVATTVLVGASITFSLSNIRDGGNVSSVANIGTGSYVINFATAMPDANYCTLVTPGSSPSEARVSSTSTGAVRIGTFGSGGGASDSSITSVAVFR